MQIGTDICNEIQMLEKELDYTTNEIDIERIKNDIEYLEDMIDRNYDECGKMDNYDANRQIEYDYYGDWDID